MRRRKVAHALAHEMQSLAGKTRVGCFLALVLREKMEISSWRSLRCRKKTSPEKFTGKVASDKCFLTTILPTGKLWGLGKVTEMKHDHRKVSWN